MNLKDGIVQIATSDPKGATTAGFALGTGLSTLLNWLSAGVGLAASIAGLILAVYMIKKARLEARLIELKIKDRLGG